MGKHVDGLLLLTLPALIVDSAVDVEDLSSQDARVFLGGDEDLGALIASNLAEAALVVLQILSGKLLGGGDLDLNLTLETVDVLNGEVGGISVADTVPLSGANEADWRGNKKKSGLWVSFKAKMGWE